MRLDARLAHHAFRVLRLKRGDRVTLFDGTGGEHEASIHAIDAKQMLIDVGKHLEVERESPLQVCIAQALASGERMAYTLEKCVELGATRFQPIIAERSVVRLAGERAQRRQEHWQQIAVAACEQCGRNRVPQVEETLELTTWLAHLPEKVSGIVLAPGAQTGIAQLAPPSEEIIATVGPEGGFTEIELDLLTRRGFTPIKLGARTLRTETAASALLAALQAQFGDFR
jgi:16S rRNA (uracil1498-N3)-methyltransferase